MVHFRPQARAEFLDARNWYERQERGLGFEFRDAVEALLSRIEANPESFSIAWQGEVREAPLRRFPYAIYYELVEGDVLILSVFHTRRNPAIWKRRFAGTR
jgi:plasmid stabilization system protein ParE